MTPHDTPADLDLILDAPDAADDAAELTAHLRRLADIGADGILTADARNDLAADLQYLLATLSAFALRVLA